MYVSVFEEEMKRRFAAAVEGVHGDAARLFDGEDQRPVALDQRQKCVDLHFAAARKGPCAEEEKAGRDAHALSLYSGSDVRVVVGPCFPGIRGVGMTGTRI